MMFTTTLKTLAATAIAVGCFTVSAEAGGHKVKNGHVGYHTAHSSSYGSSFGGSSFGGAAWPAGKGCGGTTYYRPVAVTTYAPVYARVVATRVYAAPRAPVCVCH